MMDRRGLLFGMAALAACGKRSDAPVARTHVKHMAITMDDFNLGFELSLSQKKRHDNILAAFDEVDHKAAGFVTGDYVSNSWGRKVVQDWLDQGHVIANHTWAHPRASDTQIDPYLSDIETNRNYLRQISGTSDFFRFPYLQDGRDRAHQTQLFEGLKMLGLRNAPVTIDSVDWYTSSRLEAALKTNPSTDLIPYRDYYVGMCVILAEHWNDVALALGFKSLPHQMLMHHNILNGHFLKDVLLALKAKGWSFVDAQTALEFEPYHLLPREPTNGRNWLTLKTNEMGVEIKPYPEEFIGFGRKAMDALGL